MGRDILFIGFDAVFGPSIFLVSLAGDLQGDCPNDGTDPFDDNWLIAI
jgi:hypothetical protein